MKKTAPILLFAFAILGADFEKSITAGLSGYKAFRPYIEATVEQPRGEFSWINTRRRYTVGSTALFRDYNNDHYGLYTSGALYATLGSIEVIGGLMSFHIATGIHISRIEEGYEFTELVAGFRFDSNCTFWAQKNHFRVSGVFLVGNDFLVLWTGVDLFPIKNLAIGVGLHYDGELDHWGETPFLEDYWGNGVNYYFSIGYKFDIIP